MSLQALRQIPSGNRVEELQKILAHNDWSMRTAKTAIWNFKPDFWKKIVASRQAFFTAQDEYNRLLRR